MINWQHLFLPLFTVQQYLFCANSIVCYSFKTHPNKSGGNTMITGAIKNKIDKIWLDIAAGGVTNPLTVIEQLTYLMFIRSLDEKEIETEEFENLIGKEMDKIFPQTPNGQSMRWSKFKDRDPVEIFNIIS